MRFEQALAAMREGKKVRRSSWGRSKEDWSFDRANSIFTGFRCDDIFEAIDWQIIVEEPKKLWRRPCRNHTGIWFVDQGWLPSKKRFMDFYDNFAAYGPWESRDMIEVCDE